LQNEKDGGFMFKKTLWFLILLIPLLAAACGGAETAPSPPIEQSDVVPAAGQPQFIEFYADW